MKALQKRGFLVGAEEGTASRACSSAFSGLFDLDFSRERERRVGSE